MRNAEPKFGFSNSAFRIPTSAFKVFRIPTSAFKVFRILILDPRTKILHRRIRDYGCPGAGAEAAVEDLQGPFPIFGPGNDFRIFHPIAEGFIQL